MDQKSEIKQALNKLYLDICEICNRAEDVKFLVGQTVDACDDLPDSIESDMGLSSVNDNLDDFADEARDLREHLANFEDAFIVDASNELMATIIRLNEEA